MNWEAAAALGEIIGALAVIATLFYLAVQIRQNTRVSKSHIRELRTSSSQEVLYQIAGVSDLFANAIEGEELSGSERMKLLFLIRASFRGFEAYLYHYRNDLLDEEEWFGIRNTMKAMLKWLPIAEGWEEMKGEFSEGLRELVDELTSEIRLEGQEAE